MIYHCAKSKEEKWQMMIKGILFYHQYVENKNIIFQANKFLMCYKNLTLKT